MKAVLHTGYGRPEVLALSEVETPEPKDEQVRVKIHATNVNSSDTELRSGHFPPLFWLPARLMYGLTKPRHLIPGYEFSGVVESVGKKVTELKVGDEVMGAASWQMGCSAEYLCINASGAIVIKPEAMCFKDAAAFCDGFCTALHFLTRGNIENGQKVLVFGASGSVGTAAIQLARYFGAQVTAVCSAANKNLVLSLGANNVVDYTRENFADQIGCYDIVFDTLGKIGYDDCMRALKPHGYYLSTRMKLRNRFKPLWHPPARGKNLVGGITTSQKEKINYLLGLYQQGHIKPVIDRCFPLEKIVNAHRYVDSGRKRGNVVLTIAN